MGLFSKGTIELHLSKYNYKPGDEIQGSVKIKLKKSRPGKELSVSFIGQKIDKYVTRSGVVGNSRKGTGSDTQYQTIHSFKIPLCGEQDYHQEEYHFSILIPPDILDFPEKTEAQMSSGMKTSMTAFKAIAGGTTHTRSTIKWQVKARLDMPGLDLKKTQDITLTKA